jgi:cyclic pyranopterin phosphate synthase
MAETMTFLPKSDVLTLEELDRLCSAFIKRGVRKLRVTGGEPLVRRDIIHLFQSLGRHLRTNALDELTVTTNGSQLANYAAALRDCGIRRINVSVDSLDTDKFARITRRGRLNQVLEGINAAKDAGLKIRINTVALKGINEDEFDDLIAWCGREGFDLCLIETMPMGDIDGDRTDQYLSLSTVRSRLDQRWTLVDSTYRTGGPAQFADIRETGGRIGFITPLSHNFCERCNRMRLTCTGTLYMCLGQEDCADLRAPLRASTSDIPLLAAIDEALSRKPRGHDFIIDRNLKRPTLARSMNVTGG